MENTPVGLCRSGSSRAFSRTYSLAANSYAGRAAARVLHTSGLMPPASLNGCCTSSDTREREALEPGVMASVGINGPTIRTVVKLAGVLKVSPSKIVVRMGQLLAGSKEYRVKKRFHLLISITPTGADPLPNLHGF
jgi:hypothetical protein